ncbi:hypothetical protein GCM10022421_19840 [Oceanisphaera sediminis]|uniref:Methyltransferase domain-containing protein n=2 Tax=Oceanisphaera sediminis TaxID=981381 RepID=A0ABP7E3A4_9GAMM
MGDWFGLSSLDLAQIEKQPQRTQLALYLATAQAQLGNIPSAKLSAETAKHWGVDNNTLAKFLLSCLSTSLSKAAALSGNVEKTHNLMKQALCLVASEKETQILISARLVEQLRQLDLSTSKCPTDWQLLIKPPAQQLLPMSKATLEKVKLKKAVAYLNKKQPDMAEELLVEMLLINPESIAALQELAKIKMQQQRWSEAETLHSRLLKAQPLAIKSVILKSQMLRNQDRLEEGTQLLEQAISLGLYNTNLIHQLAVAYRDTQNWKMSEKYILKILKEDPEYSESQLSFATFSADVLRKRKKVQQAYTHLKKAVNKAQLDKKEIPLTTKAILEELKREKKSAEYSIEVSKHFYDSIYAESEEYQVDPKDSIYLPVWKEVVEFIKKQNIKSVLDIGCGPGQFAQYISREIPDLNYIGIDYSQVAIDKAKNKNPSIDFYTLDIMEPGALEKFNVEAFVILEVLEHIDNDLELLSRLPKGKKVIFSVPNFDSFGHVRVFKSPSDVYDRFFDTVNIKKLKEIGIKNKAKIYLSYFF